ncbi:MAG: hypothetical protein JSV10_10280 [Candidatus Zixiibacteriota bacterium]|nr:MAG: hypothetical protein JSV10_10280 [candidate division Zixibacteria bacterium]
MKTPLALVILSSVAIASVANQQCLGQTQGDSAAVKISRPDTTLERKSPMGALLRSVAFPGWGQFYNRKHFKSAVVFGAETTFITLAAIEWGRMNKHKKNFENPNHPDRYWEFQQFEFYEDQRNLYLWITAGIVFLSMFDAYVDAHLYNFDREEVRDLSISLVPEAGGGSDVKLLLSVRF